MNEITQNSSDGSNDMDEVGLLIKLAGARETVGEERFERVRQNVRLHWEKTIEEQQSKRDRRRFNYIAFAASLVLVLGVVLVLRNLSFVPETESLATVERVFGEVIIAGKYAGEGTVIHTDTDITTGRNARIALRLSGGQSLGIDAASQVTIHSPNRVSLEAGAIYIDTVFASEQMPILVSTPMGTAQDIGTQFQVRLTGTMMIVGVRQGLVEISQPGQSELSVNRGYFVELDVTGQGEAQPLRSDDPEWDWVETVIPEFDIQGASLQQFLQWYAAEMELNLVWADETSARNAEKAMLVGSIKGSDLDESLELVMQIAPFEYQVSSDELWVKVD